MPFEFFSKINERKKDATSSQSQCPVFKRIQRHIDEQILTVLLVLTEETFSTCCNCILILLSMKSSCMRCYLFREPNKTCIFGHLSNDCQIACPVDCVARGRFFLFFFLIDSAAPKLNHRFLFRPWFIFRALCEPQNKNTPQNRQLRRLTCPALVSGPPNRKPYTR